MIIIIIIIPLHYREMLYPNKTNNSIGLNSSWEAGEFSASKIFRFLWNPKFNYHVRMASNWWLLLARITQSTRFHPIPLRSISTLQSMRRIHMDVYLTYTSVLIAVDLVQTLLPFEKPLALPCGVLWVDIKCVSASLAHPVAHLLSIRPRCCSCGLWGDFWSLVHVVGLDTATRYVCVWTKGHRN
jgi:hypothetical protein